MNKCIPLNNNVIIERHKHTKNEVDIGNGKKLFIDTSWYEEDHIIQYGIVKYPPIRLDKWLNTEVELKSGDKVYGHHFIGKDSNKIEIHEKKYNMLPYNMFYVRVRNGKIHMLSDWVLVEKVVDKEEDIITDSGIILKTQVQKKEQIGVIKHVNSTSKDFGFKPGDRILFVKDADYEMEVEGEKLFRMKNENILCKVSDDFYMDIEEQVVDEPGNIKDEIGSFDDYNKMVS